MHGRFVPVDIETFGGLCDTPDGNDVPPFMARAAENCVWRAGSVEKRPGFSQWLDIPGSYPVGLFHWAARSSLTNPTGRELVTVFRNGLVISYDPGGVELWGSAGENLAAEAVIPTAVQSYDGLVVAYAGASRPATWGGLLRYGAADGWPSMWRLFIDPPCILVTLTALAGGGSATAGTHTVWATFEMVDGSMSPPTPPYQVVTATNDRIEAYFAVYGAVPQLAGVKMVWVWCSPAGDTQNGYLVGTVAPEAMLAPLATSFIFSFADGVLTTAEKADFNALRRNAAPFMPAAVAGPYKGRVCYLGAPHRYYPGAGNQLRSKNTTFSYEGATPPGWGAPATGGAGGSGRYTITFDGAAASRGLMQNSGYVVEDLTGRCARGTTRFTAARWGVRAIARKSAGLTGASLRFGGKGSAETWFREVSVADIGTDWTLLEAPATGSSWQNDTKLYVEGRGPGVNGQYLEVCLVEAFDPGSRWEAETVWWSQPTLPRSVDMTWGPVTIGTGSGQKVRGGFALGDRWYYVLEDSLWVSQDNGGEPAQWPLEKIASGVGASSYLAVSAGTNWAVWAGPKGCWVFTGGDVSQENDLTREIKDLWGRIAWGEYGHLVTVRVMEEHKQIWIGVPLDDATAVSHILVVDYAEGFQSGIAGAGVGRRWSVWTIAPAGASLEFKDATGTMRSLIPFGTKILSLDEAVHDDGASPFAWAWESGPIGKAEGGLGLFRRVIISAEGYGNIEPVLVRASGETVALLKPTLYSPRRADAALLCSVSDERIALRLQLPAIAGVWARVNRASVWWMDRPFAGVRPVYP